MKARALIVGVEHYLPNTAFVDIPNAQNDAQELAKCLEGGGVEVVSVLDASRDKLREAIRRFCPKAQATNDVRSATHHVQTDCLASHSFCPDSPPSRGSN